MTAPRLLPALLGLAAACGTGTKQLAARFQGPAGLAPFHGYAAVKRACTVPLASCLDATHLYLAVASGAGDEIRILDPEDLTVVPAEMLVFPLSIPVALPMLLASSAAYFDPYADVADRRADLLVAASRASGILHVVNTWDGRPRVAGTIDLGPLAAGATVVALAVMPVPDPASAPAVPAPPTTCFDQTAILGNPSRPCRIGPVPEPARPAAFVAGSYRILAALSSGVLAVAEVTRDASGAFALDLTDPRNPAVVARTRALPLATIQAGTGASAAFAARDLAVSPDGWRFFAATADPLYDAAGLTVQGVARIDAWRDMADIDTNPASWPIVGLDARAATRLVAAGIFAERVPPSGYGPQSNITFHDTAQLDVLAVLDESAPTAACGFPAIDCGVVTLTPDDPAHPGIPDDPVGELGYRAPLSFPVPPAALAFLYPKRPAGHAADPGDNPFAAGAVALAPSDRARNPVMTVGAAGNQRSTTSVLAVAGMSGSVYLADPARWTAGLVGSYMAAGGRTQAAVSSSFREPATAQTILFGLWNDVESNPDWPGTKAEALVVDSSFIAQISFTPGYLPSDLWSLEWHGLLPGLSNRRATLETCGGASPSPCPVGVAALAFQQRELDGTLLTTGTIADPRSGALVGDAVVVACRDSQNGTETAAFPARVVAIKEPGDPHFPGGALVIDSAGPAGCAASADPGTPVYLDVRAAGMLLRGASYGYGGRPAISPDAASTADLLEIPQAGGADAREVAVRQIAAAKARRRAYPTDPPCGTPVLDVNLLVSTLLTPQYCSQGTLFPPDLAFIDPAKVTRVDARPAHDPVLMGPATRGAGADHHRFMMRLRVGVLCAAATATAAADTSTCLADLDHRLGMGPPGFCDGSLPTVCASTSGRIASEYGIVFSTVDGTSLYWRGSSSLAVPTSVVGVDRSQYASSAATRASEAFVSTLANQIVVASPDGSSAVVVQ